MSEDKFVWGASFCSERRSCHSLAFVDGADTENYQRINALHKWRIEKNSLKTLQVPELNASPLKSNFMKWTISLWASPSRLSVGFVFYGILFINNWLSFLNYKVVISSKAIVDIVMLCKTLKSCCEVISYLKRDNRNNLSEWNFNSYRQRTYKKGAKDFHISPNLSYSNDSTSSQISIYYNTLF